ncbi:MAG: response regulator transcription factor [Chitinophagaceae bacterium]
MKILNCLIVDDEPIAREILFTYCSHLPFLQVVGECKNALEAKKILGEARIDLLFLDIHLPVLDGMGFFSTLKNPPMVIFTTAYTEYAVKAFDIAACDYLVKPFTLDRFIVAVDKAMERINAADKNNTGIEGAVTSSDSFFAKADGKFSKIVFTDLLYAEAQGNYIKLVSVDFSILPNMSFISLEKLLPPLLFRRVHRSFIVNLSKITHVEGNRVFIGKHEIPIGNSYKESLFNYLGL